MMPDLEKVLKALECCKNKTCDNAKPDVVCPYSGWSGEYETSYCECTERLAADAHALLKAQEPRWISVKDRLPEKTERYMCLCYDFVTKSYWHELLWYENNCWWKSLATLEYDYKKHVVYWMPLPEPPKEES